VGDEFAGQTVNPGYVSGYTDVGVDWQYLYNGVNTILSAHLVPTYFSSPTDHLDRTMLTAEVVNNNQNPFFLNERPNPKASDNNASVLGPWMDFQ